MPMERAGHIHMAMTEEGDRRQRPRVDSVRLTEMLIETEGNHEVKAEVLDVSEKGFGVRVDVPLRQGLEVEISGTIRAPEGTRKLSMKAKVEWCVPAKEGYRAGLTGQIPPILWFRVAPGTSRAYSATQESAAPPAPEQQSVLDEVDYYEVLQLSVTADLDTIHRVYRLLAQRYHPDNRETGSPDKFNWITNAYSVLSDPARRAKYDLERALEQQTRVKVFSKPADAEGIEGEKRKRRGILAILYTQRMNDARNPGVLINLFEELMGVPREHLEFAIWFLKERQLIGRTDSSRYYITAKGVEYAENEDPVEVIRRPMLEAPKRVFA
ncbi:MAG: DnaJ domain-containing protein [Bryobacteraceae bacterium]|nr:DnaJ domain-containing protein [Bryobacteraceae bacterium]